MNIKKSILVSGICTIMLVWSSYATGIVPTLTNVNVNNWDVLVKDVINNLQSNIDKVYNWIKGWFTVNGNIELSWNVSRSLVLNVNSQPWTIINDSTANNLSFLKQSNTIFKLSDTEGILNVPLKIANLLELENNSKKGFIKNNDGTIEISTDTIADDGIVLNSSWYNIATFKKSWVIIDSHDISLKATWTNKWLRIKSDGSVCIGACW